MKVEERCVGDVTIVAASGKSSFPETPLWDKVDSLIKSGSTKILVDLSGVSFLDSSGVGELVRCLVTLNRNSGKLILLSPSSRVRHLLETCQLARLFEICEDEKDAVKRF